jgi:hypothetical protein
MVLYSSPGNQEVSEERKLQIMNMITDRIVRHGLVTPAIFFFQMGKPLAFIGSQSVFMASPFLGAIFDERLIEDFGHVMSDRENVELLLVMLEEKDIAARAQLKEAREQLKAEKQRKKDEKRLAKEAKQKDK